MITVQCNTCGKDFNVDTRKYNNYKKHGWNFYCSDCKYGSGINIVLKCPICGKEFTRKQW